MYQLVKTSKKSKFIWADEHQCAFENIIAEIINVVTLVYPNSEDTFILVTYASDHCTGAELSQVQNDHERLISFASKVLTAEQRKYCTTRKESLAIITFIRQFRHFLFGSFVHHKVRQLDLAFKFQKTLKASLLVG